MPTGLSIPSMATAHAIRTTAAPRSPCVTRYSRFRLAKMQFTGRLPPPPRLSATKLLRPSLKAVDANGSSKAATTVVRWPRTQCVDSRRSRVHACGHVVPIPRRPTSLFVWVCSTTRLSSPARSPSASPEIMNKGAPSSSRLIYATAPPGLIPQPCITYRYDRRIARLIPARLPNHPLGRRLLLRNLQ